MSDSAIREQLHKQIDNLPEEIVEQIVDFKWSHSQWQDFVLSQFFREDDEVTYTLNEAKEVYSP